ncbi:uncharacterized protein BXZ73DRAFT_87385 [Epithele typhae]|uniref:uncharacterized protein n=1 Tax=Epithele typhae TaxID=378194 RepID=UPI002008643D|nr:uncharacterized protein BXZ73DRAFT_87385 [Epithele typhae]KAH9944501.1 hypothetical protein BXZ73DRAFT_87385 [Epithele typhae]
MWGLSLVTTAAGPAAAFKRLSSIEAIQFILADIPLYTVGILAFGSLTFFFLMKRVDRWVFCIHVAILLAFLAGVLDLAQILLRVPPAYGIITAREIFYAMSNSLRFLFYWGFVAMIPLGETIPEGNIAHSGSWRRWGTLGIFLKWITVFVQVVMFVLQLLYRNITSLGQIGPVYETEATLEIILSAFFILKLLMNTLSVMPTRATRQSKGKMLVQYSPIIVTLLFSLWIAVGNAILFEFTETVLGRFMRAIEFYIDVVYVMTVSFIHLRHLSFFPVYRPNRKRSEGSLAGSFTSFEKPGAFVEAMPTPNDTKVQAKLMYVLEDRYYNGQNLPQTMDSTKAPMMVEGVIPHQSMAGRLSTWLGRPRPGQNDSRPWDVDAERGPSPRLPTISTPWTERARPESPLIVSFPIPRLDEDEQRAPSGPLPPGEVASVMGLAPSSTGANTRIPSREWQDIEFSNAVRNSGVNEEVMASALKERFYVPPQEAALESPFETNIEVLSPQSEEGTRPNSIASVQYAAASTPMSPPSKSAALSLYPASPLASAAASPIPRSRPLPPMPVPNRPTSSASALLSPTSPMPPDSARSSNISILLRRQNELDESIAALRCSDAAPFDTASAVRLLGAGQLDASLHHAATEPGAAVDDPRTVIDTAAQSEFYFDSQPPLNRSSIDSGVWPPPTPPPQTKELAVTFLDSPPNALAPPRQPESRFSDASSLGDRKPRKAVDSAGTQYDITSFVGNLTSPVNPKYSVMSEFSSEESFANVVTARPAQYVRPTLVAHERRESDPADIANLALVSQFPAPPLPAPTAARPLPTIAEPARPTIQTQLPPQSQSPAQSPARTQLPSPPQPRFKRAVGLPAHPRLSRASTASEEVPERTPQGDTSSLYTSQGSGTPNTVTGRAW